MSTVTAAYTPGPWRPLLLNWGAQIVPATEKQSRRRPVIGTVTSWTNDPREDQEGRANAYLMAAAPDLLAVVRLFMEPGESRATDRYAAAEAAIAKAEARS